VGCSRRDDDDDVDAAAAADDDGDALPDLRMLYQVCVCFLRSVDDFDYYDDNDDDNGDDHPCKQCFIKYSLRLIKLK